MYKNESDKSDYVNIFLLNNFKVLESRMYRCGQSQSSLDNFYKESLIRKVVVDKLVDGVKYTMIEVELMEVKKYTKNTTLEIPSPAKKEVSLMFEIGRNYESFKSLEGQGDEFGQSENAIQDLEGN